MSSYSVRRPTGSRSVSDQIPYAARSDCVRCPIGLRTQNGRKLHADGPKSLGKTAPNLMQSHQKPRANLQKAPR